MRYGKGSDLKIKQEAVSGKQLILSAMIVTVLLIESAESGASAHSSQLTAH